MPVVDGCRPLRVRNGRKPSCASDDTFVLVLFSLFFRYSFFFFLPVFKNLRFYSIDQLPETKECVRVVQRARLGPEKIGRKNSMFLVSTEFLIQPVKIKKVTMHVFAHSFSIQNRYFWIWYLKAPLKLKLCFIVCDNYVAKKSILSDFRKNTEKSSFNIIYFLVLKYNRKVICIMIHTGSSICHLLTTY